MKILASLFVAIMLTACAVTGGVFGDSPESQIKTGGDSLKATIVVSSALLRNDAITAAQAKSYRGMMGSASDLLDASFKKLEDCRKKTGSTEKTAPDPCKATVADDIDLALSVAQKVKTTVDAKK